MHNHHDKYLAQPVFEPGRPTSRLQAPVDTNEPSGSPECTLKNFCSVKFKMADHRPLFDMYDIWKPCQIARPLL